MKYHVYYNKETRPWDRNTPNSNVLLGVTHIFVRTVAGEAPDDVFLAMQGENWSPHGEANILMEYLGLQHASMSVGDVLVDEQGKLLFCSNRGWSQIEEVDPRVVAFMDRDDRSFMFGHWRSQQPLSVEQWRNVGEMASWLEGHIASEDWDADQLPPQLQGAEGVEAYIAAIYGMFLRPASAPIYLSI